MSPSFCVLATTVLCTVLASFAAADPGSVAAGEKIYRQGVLASGAPLQGQRQDGGAGAGAVVACVSCHRRSGLGSGEGTIRIAPITSKYLFSKSGVSVSQPAPVNASSTASDRIGYDDKSLAAAIRTGVGRGGRKLNLLMPRYVLDDANMASLIAYLKSLPITVSPGVTDTSIDFATIVTPDADPVGRDGMLAVLNQFVDDKNMFIRGGKRPLQANAQINFRLTRSWNLHVWNLRGSADTWEEQLHNHLQAEPVFAVLSGIGGQSWGPVHRFCERAQVPCLFPNVDLPVDAEQDFYSIYFSKGQLLEAELLATRLNSTAAPAGARVIQVYALGDAVEAAVSKLTALVSAGVRVVERPVRTGDAAALTSAMSEVQPGDSLVLWLRPENLTLLSATPPAATAVYISGSLAGLEHAPLPAAWRSVAQLTYAVDLPESRALRMTYPLRWLQIHRIPVVAEKIQADTYLACGIVAEGLSQMLDSYMRDYLIERIESMLSQRQLSGYYPRLGVGNGQRFASKGGYFVRFTESSGTAIAADGEWIVP